jgi:hypothetical protein
MLATPIISAFEKLRQEVHEFEASLGSIPRFWLKKKIPNKAKKEIKISIGGGIVHWQSQLKKR